MNKPLLLKAAAAFEANPKHFGMSDWFCGTTACIGGWVLHIYWKHEKLSQTIDKWLGNVRFNEAYIQKILEIDYADFEALTSVFWWRNEKLENAFQAAKHSKKKAKIAAEYVRWFVRTDGGTL
jgi:hypothetical protein